MNRTRTAAALLWLTVACLVLTAAGFAAAVLWGSPEGAMLSITGGAWRLPAYIAPVSVVTALAVVPRWTSSREVSVGIRILAIGGAKRRQMMREALTI